MNKRIVLCEYDQILIGKKKSFAPTYFPFNDEQNEKLALDVFKYAVENYLEWTPEETKMYLNADIIKQMKLNFVTRFIRFPAELDPKKDFFYIAHLMYPDKIKYNTKELILNVYKKVLDGTLCKFPKEYKEGARGFMCAGVCFQYMLEQYFQFSGIEELYEYFASSNGMKALKQYRLASMCSEMFESPLDYLHESLPNRQKNEFLYRRYKFEASNAAQVKQLKKENEYIL